LANPAITAGGGAARPAITAGGESARETGHIQAAPTKQTAIKEPAKEPRRSARIAAIADVHTMHKIERLAAKKNLEAGNSFSSFPDSKIISNLGRVGINLGSSDVAVIKNLEVDRLVLCANQKKENIAKSKHSYLVSDDEQEDRLEAVLSHACGDLNENMLDQEDDQIIDLSRLRRKKKYNNAKNTNKGKLPESQRLPPKLI
jgi:hypothetical protein